MKKQTVAVLLAAALLLTATGCSAGKLINEIDRAEDKIEANLDAMENQVEEQLQQVLEPTVGTGELTEEEAKQIALEHAGLTVEQVVFSRTEYDLDDGIPQYEIELTDGQWEYEFEIHAQSGKILSYNKDQLDD